jgi:hypothetical protein
MNKCKNCKYFIPIGEEMVKGMSGKLEKSWMTRCARFPPNYSAWWAMPEEGQWCAEFKPKETK